MENLLVDMGRDVEILGRLANLEDKDDPGQEEREDQVQQEEEQRGQKFKQGSISKKRRGDVERSCKSPKPSCCTVLDSF